MAGFNNRVGIIALVLGVAVLCVRALVRPGPKTGVVDAALCVSRPGFPRMPKSLLILTSALLTLFTLAYYYCIPHLDEYGESLYALPRLDMAMRYGLRLFSDVQWNYGPAMFYVHLLGMKLAWALDLDPEWGFCAALIAWRILGAWALFYVIDHLRIKLAYRILLFALIGGPMTTDFSFAVQGSLLAPLAPYLAILALHRTTRGLEPPMARKAILRFFGIALLCSLGVLSVRIDLGITYGIVQTVYCGYSAWAGNRWKSIGIAASALSLAIWILVFPGSAEMVAGFAGGGGNNPIYPSLFMFGYLACLLWVVPALCKACLVRKPGVNAPLIAALGAEIVSHIPPCISQCNAPHIYGQGLSVWIVTFAVLAACRPRLLPAFLTLFLIVFVVGMWVASAIAYSSHLRFVSMTLAGHREVAVKSESPLVRALNLYNYRAVITPLGVDRATRAFLMDTGRYVPEYHPDMVSVVTRTDVGRKLRDLEKAEVVLVPESILQFGQASDAQIEASLTASRAQRDDGISWQLGIGNLTPVQFRSQSNPYLPYIDVARHIARNYKPIPPIRAGTGWTLMVRDAPK